MVSENDFYLLNGNSYRGSRYANFSGAGVDPQGNVSQATNEDAANSSVGTHADASSQPKIGGTIQQASPGLTAPPNPTKALTQAAIGTALPYAGQTIGAAAGNAFNAGSGIGNAIGEGVSSLTNKVGLSSGLLGGFSGLGAGETATNAALKTLGTSYGPATSSAVNGVSGNALSDGASVGGSIGTGVGTLAADLIGGQKLGKSLIDAGATGLGNYAGAAIGQALIPIPGVGAVIGGFIGGTIGHIFCFVADTPIMMADGTRKMVQDLEVGDDVLTGGAVMAHGKASVDGLVSYKNTIVAGTHAVFEDGKWVRAVNSSLSSPIMDSGIIVYPVVTKNHLLVTPWFVSADLLELDPRADGGALSDIERLAILNANIDRNAGLAMLEEEVCGVC